MSMDLRPLTLGELLDRAFTLYRRHFRLFVGVMAVPSVLALGFALIVAVFQRKTAAGLTPEAIAAGTVPPSFSLIAGYFAGMMLVFFAYLVVYMVALGATTLAVSEIYLGRSVTIGNVYGRMRGRVGSLALLMLLATVRIGGVVMLAGILMAVASVIGSLASPLLGAGIMIVSLLAVTGLVIFMMLRYGVAVPALVLEGVSAGEAIRRSIYLTGGNLTRVFLLGLCATVISYAGIALFQGPFIVGSFMAGQETARGFWLGLAGTVSGTIGGTFTAPIMIIGLALLYYDTRIRHEGLDLELMIAALDQKGRPPAPSRA